MFLDEIISAQKRGEARGIISLCSAHPWVITAAMSGREGPLLIEATCHQVNQYGGYTGMTPRDFVGYVAGIAQKAGYPEKQLILGGDHLGPNVWKNESASIAMEKSRILVQEYVRAGFTKIHVDTSMRLGDDPEGMPDTELIARRTAVLVKCAEEAASDTQRLRYVIGSEVPTPGGLQEHNEGTQVTTVESIRQTLEVTRQAFTDDGVWERVSALVVHSGVEFGDDFILPYDSRQAAALSRYIESQPLVYEAHSTDYQTQAALREMVRDHFAILKVGPALTNAFREVVLWLTMIEEEKLPANDRSNIVAVLDAVMLEHPEHWRDYYHGNEEQLAHKRFTSLSDRIRYYWSEPRVQQALDRLLANLAQQDINSAFMQLSGTEAVTNRWSPDLPITPERVIIANICCVLDAYDRAIGE